MKAPKKEKPQQPLFRYLGGKRWLADMAFEVISAQELPTAYVEPFLGGGAVALRVAVKAPELPLILNDYNDALANLWHHIIYHPRLLYFLIRWTEQRYPHTEAAYEEVRAIFNRVRVSAIEAEWDLAQVKTASAMAAFMLYLITHGYNGLWRENKGGEYNAPFGGYHQRKFRYAPEKDFLAVSALLRKRARVSAFDFEPVIDAAPPQALIFSDPPYFIPKKGFDQYTRQRFSEADQRRLAAAMKRAAERGVRILSTNAAHPVISEIYDWARVEIIQERRSVGATVERRAKAPCVLIQYP